MSRSRYVSRRVRRVASIASSRSTAYTRPEGPMSFAIGIVQYPGPQPMSTAAPPTFIGNFDRISFAGR